MNYNVIATEPFERKLKRLAKKYKSLKDDLAPVFAQLALQPDLGTPIGHNCYKVRISIASKGKGKSGGARMITYLRIVKSTVYLMDIYDKWEQSNISESELRYLIGLMAK